jgi:hypothetical protein
MRATTVAIASKTSAAISASARCRACAFMYRSWVYRLYNPNAAGGGAECVFFASLRCRARRLMRDGRQDHYGKYVQTQMARSRSVPNRAEATRR